MMLPQEQQQLPSVLLTVVMMLLLPTSSVLPMMSLLSRKPPPVRRTAAAVGRTGGVRVIERDGTVFSSSALVRRMAFQRSGAEVDDPCGLTGCTATKMAFQLSSAGGFALRDWGAGGEYATQAHLVTEKLASLGGPEDLDYLRQELLKESVTDGVCHVSGTQWHLGYQGGWEVNAEWVLSVQRYIAHSGDVNYTDRVPERLVCVEEAGTASPVLATATRKGLPSGETACSTPVDVLRDFFSTNGAEGVAGLFVEHLFPPSSLMPEPRNLENAGKRLAQWVELPRPFVALRLPISAWGVAPVQGLALWPFNLTLTDAAGREVATIAVSNIDTVAPRNPAPVLSSWVRLAPSNNATVLPAGKYLVTMTAHSIQNRTQQNGFWNGAGWLTDAIPERAPLTTGSNVSRIGALSATYSLHQLQSANLPPLQPMALRTKLRQAMEWALSKMRRTDGSYGTFVMDDARFCGSNHSVLDNQTWPSGRCWPGCSYYDTLRMGFKSSYWALLYLQAMNAYSSLQDLHVVDRMITEDMIAAVARDISKQYVNDETGEVAAWISCDLPPTEAMTSACSAKEVLQNEQTVVAYGFMPSLALAVKLGIEPRAVLLRHLEEMRTKTQVFGTTWQLNSFPLEYVSPRFWWPTDRSEPAVDADGFALRSLTKAPLNSDWQMFREGDGIGNWGLNAQNGGNALGTSSYVLQAGPYPGVYRDYKKTVSAFDSVLQTLVQAKQGSANSSIMNGSLLAPVPAAQQACLDPAKPAGCLLRRPLKPGGIVQQLCRRVRLAFGQRPEKDSRNTTNCDWYPNVELALPENSAWLSDFVVAVLGLDVSSPIGELKVYGTTVPIGALPTVVQLDSVTAANLPVEVDSMTVVGLNVFGVSVNVTCGFGHRELACSAVAMDSL
eukprot:COSAG01_NODE_5619_length_4142_cov_9.969577_1_plen_894_part_00